MIISIYVLITYSISFFNKEESNITILSAKHHSSENPYYNLKEHRFLIGATHYLFGYNPDHLFPLRAYHVTKNMRTGATTRVPLTLFSCDLVDINLAEIGLTPAQRNIVPYQECMQFS